MRLSSRLLAVSLLTLIATAGPGFAQARVFQNAPPASWIAPPDVQPNAAVVFHARKSFDLATKPDHFVVHVSADSRYRLFVNGTQVTSGPQRSDVTHWRYETVDLAPQLRAGRNVIAALVWNWGTFRPVAQHSYRPAFLVQGNSEREASLLNTGAGWKLKTDSGYKFLPNAPGEIRGYYAASPGESVDGAQVPWGWETTEFDDAGWFTVSSGRGSGPQTGLAARMQLRAVPGQGEPSGWWLTARTLPPMEETPQRFARVRRTVGISATDAFVNENAETIIPAHTKASVLLDQGHTTNAYTVLETSGGAGSTVTLTYAEALVDDKGQKGNRNEVDGRTIHGLRDVIRPDGGEHRRFQSLYWRSYRYVQMDVETADEPLRVNDLHGIFTGYPFQERGRFSSDQPWIADIWKMNWNGARLGAFETYMDTPYYEQLQYVGDTRVQALISLYVGGDDRLMRQAIEHFDASRIPDGITMSRYPSAGMQLIPPFSLIYVAMVHDYHMYRGDPAFVRQRLASIRGVLDWYQSYVDSTGMLGPMPYWNYLDWVRHWPGGTPPGANDGHSAAISLLYVYALQHAAALEEDVGVRGLGAAYRARADSIIRVVRSRTWDASRGLFRDSPDKPGYSQHTNVLALLTGAIPVAERRPVLQRVLSDTTIEQATYYFSFYVLEALREGGLADRYVESLKPWRDMLALGLTSAPEEPEPTRSDTHAWAAHPNYGLLATVLGIRPASPGFKTVRIAPALGPLKHAEGRVPHPLGDIEVSLDRVGTSGLKGFVTLPPGLSGTFEWGGKQIPLRPGRTVVQ